MGFSRVYDSKLFKNRLKEVAEVRFDKEIAEKLHVDANKVSRWFRGQEPELSDLLNIAAEFHCSIDYLLGLEDNNRAWTTQNYTARDVCRILTEIDRQYHLNAEVQSEPGNCNDEDFMLGKIKAQNITRYKVMLSFPAHAEEIIAKTPEGVLMGTGVYIIAGVPINEYLRKYFGLKKQEDVLMETLTDKDIAELYEGMIANVPEEMPPYPVE